MTDISTVPVELWDVADVKPYEFNHKKHPPAQIDLLARLIDAKGLINPLVLEEDGTVIAGHGRLLAIQKLGRAKVAVRVLRGISKGEASGLRIADNKTVSNEYDTDMLSKEITELSLGGDFDLTLLGLDQRELDMLITDVGEIDMDAVVGDIDLAVEQHEADVDERAAQADEDSVRLDKAFGFKTIPLPSQKTVTRFMAEIESTTGKTGAEALIEHMRSALAA